MRIQQATLLLLLLVLGACSEGAGGDPAPRPSKPVAPPSLVAQALPLFKEAKGRRGMPMTSRIKMALGGMRRGYFEGARKMLQEELEEHPQSELAGYLVGCTYYEEQQYAAALPWFEKTLAGGPAFEGSESVFYRYGRSLYYLGEGARSREALLAYLEIDPGNGDTLFLLGLLAQENGDLQQAVERLQQALAAFELQEKQGRPGMARHVAKVHARLGEIYQQQGELAKARDELQLCVILWPQHYEPWFKLSRVLMRLGDEEGSRAAMEEFVARKKAAGR